MGSKGGGSTTTVQKADPWSGQQPYLYDVFSEAKRLYDSGQMSASPFPGQTVAPQSEWTLQALQMQADRALAGSASLQGAQEAVDGIASGQAMAGSAGLDALTALGQTDVNAGNAGLAALEAMSSAQNPWLDAQYQNASREALTALDSSFSRAGRYGSGAHAAAGADAVTDLAAQMYGSAYEQQMQAAAHAASAYNAGLGQQISAAQSAGQLYNTGLAQQLAAAGLTQELANQAYTDAAALGEAGALQEGYAQQLINADIARWNQNELQALDALNSYNQIIQGNYGSATTTSTEQGSPGGKLGGFMSGAAAGAGMGASLGGPWGALIGGVGGGLLGLF